MWWRGLLCRPPSRVTPRQKPRKTPLFLPWALCNLRGVRARRHWALGGVPVVGLPQAATRGAGLARGVLREGCEGVHQCLQPGAERAG